MHSPPSYNPEAEKRVLMGLATFPAETSQLCAKENVIPADFLTPAYRELFEVFKDFIADGRTLGFMSVGERLKERGTYVSIVGGAPILSEILTPFAEASEEVPVSIRAVKSQSLRRNLFSLSGHLEKLSTDQTQDPRKSLVQVHEAIGSIVTSQEGRGLDSRRFDILNRPARPVPIIELIGHTVATAGNLFGIQGKVKQGKTGAVTGVLAAAIKPGADHLGFTCAPCGGRMVLHFDTEQSRFDSFNVVDSALRRNGMTEPPPWLHSYCVTDMTLVERREAFFARLAEGHASGGVFLAVLDGVADLVASPNDEAEAIALIDRLHQAAIRYDTAILCTLHENPGSDIGKTRGHLGSQLERKAETNLRLEKDGDGVTVIYTERARHCHIPKDQGPRFAWDDAAGMHLPVATRSSSKQDEKRESYTLQLEEAYGDTVGGMAWSELLPRIAKAAGIKEGGVRRKFDEMRKLGLLVQRSGKWVFKP